MGRRFWVGCGFFSWGDGGKEEETLGHLRHGLFFRWTTRVSEHPFLCTRVMFKFREPDDLFHTLKTVKELLNLVPSRTPRSSGYGVLYSCGLCYMLFLLCV